jgi:hypothetical protein
MVYNGQILSDPDGYGSNLLYVKADVLFCISAGFYLLGSMRDAGFFFWLPLKGCKSLRQYEVEDGDSTTDTTESTV